MTITAMDEKSMNISFFQLLCIVTFLVFQLETFIFQILQVY